MTNPLAEALRARRFCYVVELVASGLSREARLLEVASRLAALPEVAAGSITSYAGGAMGHDPIRVGTAARARGLTPNIHITCVGEDREGLRKTLEDLHALDIENVFALTGDYPKTGAGQPAPVFDLDSVQLVRLIAELRHAGMGFHVAVGVSPFKYIEADCVYQYLKLEKKITAGADVVITQLGWDTLKFAELMRYMAERGLTTPVLGNVYVLGPKAAERMATGQPPGCWVSPALLETVRAESAAKDRGLRARLERAAHQVAVLRGLGYAGAYLGGTHDADHVAWIIRRSGELAPRWEELAEALRYGDPGGYYTVRSPVATTVGALAARAANARPSGPPAAGDARHVAPPAHACPHGLAGPTTDTRRRARARGARHEEADVRLPGVRQLRPGTHGIRVPADLPQADAQRAVWRHPARPLRSGGPALHLGGRVPACQNRRTSRQSRGLHSPSRPLAARDQLVDQLFSRS